VFAGFQKYLYQYPR